MPNDPLDGMGQFSQSFKRQVLALHWNENTILGSH